MSSGDYSDDEPLSTNMLEEICDGSQSHPIINRREEGYNVKNNFKRRQGEQKGDLLTTRNMGKGLHKVLKDVVNYISQSLPSLGESGSEVSYFIP